MNNEIIFLAEDDLHIQQLVKYNLKNAGYDVHTFDNGEDLLEMTLKNVPDIFLLDIMLPGADGFEVCKKLKSNVSTSNIPIIFLTAKGEEVEKVLGLELGADDYIVKPFSVRELSARIKAVLRRTRKSSYNDNTSIITLGMLSVDIEKHEVTKNGNVIEMTLKEFELLKILMQNKGKVLSREFLLEEVWGYEYYAKTRTVDVHIRFLRQKIEENDSSPNLIETVRGIGYRFNDSHS
jgi:two-component system alkaline phosphatase synthesis response regulator PhoP